MGRPSPQDSLIPAGLEFSQVPYSIRESHDDMVQQICPISILCSAMVCIGTKILDHWCPLNMTTTISKWSVGNTTALVTVRILRPPATASGDGKRFTIWNRLAPDRKVVHWQGSFRNSDSACDRAMASRPSKGEGSKQRRMCSSSRQGCESTHSHRHCSFGSGTRTVHARTIQRRSETVPTPAEAILDCALLSLRL